MLLQVTTNEEPTKTVDWSPETQIQKNEIIYQIDDKTTMIHLSNAVNMVTSSLMEIMKTSGASYVDDLEGLTYPLKDVIMFIWSTPMDELFQDNLYFLFDKILDIVYCTYEILDEVWHGSTYIIESKLSQISLNIIRIVREMKTLSESEYKMEFETNLRKVNETIVELTMSLVGLTTLTTSIAHLVITRDRNVFLVIGTIASLIIIHQYALSAVACLLSRAVKVIDSIDVIHTTGISSLEATIIDFISKLQPIVMHNYREATMTQLFHGDLHSNLSTQLIISLNEQIGSKIIVNTIRNTTTSVLHIIKENAPREFHVLPDLIDQLTIILYQCGHTEFRRLEPFITYAFDGLYDVLHHISYRMDKHIQSSASTGSFSEPSEPIDAALGNVKASVKRFIYDTQHIRNANATDINANLISSTMQVMKALLQPMNIVVHKSDSDLDVTLASTLQFVALYVVGLVATPLISAVKSFHNIGGKYDIYSNFSAILSVVVIKVQMIFDHSKMQSTKELSERLYETVDNLFRDLSRICTESDGVIATRRRSTTSVKMYKILNLI